VYQVGYCTHDGDLSQATKEDLGLHPSSRPEPYEFSSSHSVSLISVFPLNVPALQFTPEFGSNFIELQTACCLIDQIRKRHEGLKACRYDPVASS
jgi:hypothetical protein